MNLISRRRLLSAGAFGAGVASLPFLQRAAYAATRTRYDLTSTDGQKMLKIYADGVGKMMKMKQGDPRGWLFQWYTHAVRDDRTKASEISRVYGSKTSPDRQLATATWSTCEAHFSNKENFFLPWHRMYVLCFEEIVRQITGEDSFTLPYWNYTDASQRALPADFRKQNDPVWGPFYRANRTSGVNNGTAIDQIPGAVPFDLSAMKSIVYGPTNGDAGFCANTDNNPHGCIHDDVGNGHGMGAIPWAANDPIFWMHHCNIDRIWASWNKAGGQNPSLTGTYTFADKNGKKVQLSAPKFVDPDTASALGYQYDRYLNRPAGSPAFPSDSRLVAFAVHAATRQSAGPINLGASPSTVSLVSTAAAPAQPSGATPLSESLRALGPARQFILRLENVRAQAPPGVGYDVYYGLGQAQPSRENPAYAGSLSFFGATAMADHGAMAEMPFRTYSFYVTEPVRLALDKSADAASAITLVPTGAPAQGSTPTIGSISLVSA
jgi:tyrosinase